MFKAVRGEYGSGKTFFARWLAERAKRARLGRGRGPDLRDRDAAAPAGDGLPAADRAAGHRRATRPARCGRSSTPGSSRWRRTSSPPARSPTTTPTRSTAAVDELLEQRLAEVARHAPAFAAALRGYRRGRRARRRAPPPRRSLAWLGGQPHVAAVGPPGRRGARRPRPLRRARLPAGAADRAARLRAPRPAARPRRGRDAAAGPLRRAGQGAQRAAAAHRRGRLRPLPRPVPASSPARPRSSTGQQGVQRLPPLAQRLATDFTTDPRFDNPRAVQIRLPGFDLRLASVELGGTRPRPVRRRAHASRAGRGRGRRRLRRRPGRGRRRRARRQGRRRAAAVPARSSSATCSTASTQFADFDPRQHYALTRGRRRADRRRAQRAPRADDVDAATSEP